MARVNTMRAIVLRVLHILRENGLRGFVRVALFYALYEISSRIEYLKFLVVHPLQFKTRIQILKRFKEIHKSIPCEHQFAQLLHIADEILMLSKDLEGDIIECGVYKGGSTCKLSIVAKIAGRKLIACDSFMGLPEPKEYDKVQIYININGKSKKAFFKRGYFHGTLEEFKRNLERFGEPEVVEIIPGWFHETFPRLRESGRKIVLAFIDVDLYDSIICCIENIYPMLQEGCKLYTHEAHHLSTIRAFSNMEVWKKLGESKPPTLVGALKGLGISKHSLGYIQKPKSITKRMANS